MIDHNAHSPQLFYAVGIETSSTHSSALAASFEKQIYSAMTWHMVNIPWWEVWEQWAAGKFTYKCTIIFQLIDALIWTLKKWQNLCLMMMAKTHPKHLAEANWWLLSALCSCVKEVAYLQRLLQESFKQHTQLSLVQGLSFDNYNPKYYYQECNSNFMLSGVTYCCSSNYHNMATCTTAGYESATRIQEIFS